MHSSSAIVRHLGRQEYADCWQAMKSFTDQRNDDSQDEIWVVEHPPIFTLGQNGKAEHILDAGNIPVLPVDRGGQVTYHGPGQVVIYTLIDVKRKKFNVRQLVNALERAIIQLLNAYGVDGKAKCEAPGVYVDSKKIASVGLRIRRGCAYHGLAFNVDMDLAPFARINPCGYAELKMTQLKDLAESVETSQVANQLIEYLIAILGYTTALTQTGTLYGTHQSD